MSKIGYARVSTRDQNLNSQIDVLNRHGCDRIFSEKGMDLCQEYGHIKSGQFI